jgi:hypothetical protein
LPKAEFTAKAEVEVKFKLIFLCLAELQGLSFNAENEKELHSDE